MPGKSLEEMGGGVSVESAYGWGNLSEDWAHVRWTFDKICVDLKCLALFGKA